MTRSRYPLLTGNALNRATLARQLLLERSSMDLVTAIEHIGGLQAQEPASPFVALWSRLEGFDPRALEEAFRRRRVFKATLMRTTVHAVSRDDYLRLLPALRPMLHGRVRRGTGGPAIRDLDRLVRAAIDFAQEPRTNPEMRDHVAALAGEVGTDDAWWLVRRQAPFVHVPADVSWSFGRRPTLIAAGAWLRGRAFADEDPAVAHLLRRYLAAFGPATVADAAAWSGLPVVRIRAGVGQLDADGMTERFSDEAGRELLDLAGSPRPDPDVPAPPRLLAMWDAILLGHADRTRIVSDEQRRIVIGSNGDVLPTFLVDGRVAGLWWVESDGDTGRVVLEPIGQLRREDRRALEVEGEGLVALVQPYEPSVYVRYRRSRARRPGR